MNSPSRKPGFRFSTSDAVIILVGSLLTWLSSKFLGSLSMVFVIVLFHFFLFCNVFRIRRQYELVWAGVFIANVLVCSELEIWNWWLILSVQAPFTLIAILLEIRSEHYHGIGYIRKARARLRSENSS